LVGDAPSRVGCEKCLTLLGPACGQRYGGRWGAGLIFLTG
jgi:hypothetical protein